LIGIKPGIGAQCKNPVKAPGSGARKIRNRRKDLDTVLK